MKLHCFFVQCVFFVVVIVNVSIINGEDEVTTLAPGISESESDLIEDSADIISKPRSHDSDASEDELKEEVSRWRDGSHNQDQNNSVNVILKNTEENDLDTWEAPTYIRNNYPFYLTGFDDENHPIWVAEWGKFDLHKIVQAGKETVDIFDKYVKKTVKTIIKSHELRSTPENPVNQAAFIIDFDHLKLEQLADLKTVTYALKLGRENRDIIENHTSQVFIINANFVAELVINLAKRVFTRLFENLQVYGNNKAKWLPHIIRAFPQDQLPPWYGGPKDHKPIIVCG